jgi:hypothetical protein
MDGSSYEQPGLTFSYETVRHEWLLGNSRFKYPVSEHLARGLADWERCQNTPPPETRGPDLPAMSLEPETAATGLVLSYGGSGYGTRTGS